MSMVRHGFPLTASSTLQTGRPSYFVMSLERDQITNRRPI